MTEDRGGWTPEVDRRLVELLPKIEESLGLLPQLMAETSKIAAQVEARNEMVDKEMRGIWGRVEQDSDKLQRDLLAITELRRDMALLDQRVTTHNGRAQQVTVNERDLAVVRSQVQHLSEACEKMEALQDNQQRIERTQYLLGISIVLFSILGPEISKVVIGVAGAVVGAGP